MAKSKLDSIVEAFDIPEDTTGDQLDDEEIEDEAQKLNEEDIKPKVKEKESEKDGDSQSDLPNVE